MELLHGASKSLNEAKSFAIENRACLTGDVEIFLADVSWWLGRVTLDLGQPEMAADYFKNTRSEAAMAHPHFAQEIGMSAWLGEAEALMLSGRVNDATNTVNSLIQDSRAPKNIKKKARAFNEYLERRVRPVIDWFKSTEAQTIYRESKKNGLRDSVTQQLEPLISWWKEWHEEKSGPESELLDFWGRGGFSRLAAAVRSKPYSAIAVDARSINEIRLWARIFCPLFDTVIVKWKGNLGSGIVFAPIHEKYGNNEEFGGHGYLVAAGDRLSKKDWCPALSWANPLPREVSVFLASEALPLLSEGRLIVLPAPLVGCTQSAIGWTDDLLVDNFLGGVVNVAKQPDYSKAEATKGHQKILDLAKISIPYIDNIRLSDLAKVLDETEEWVGPLRSFLIRSICSDDLKKENWAKIALIEGDIHDAFRIFQEQLTSLVQNRKQETWKVCEATGSFSAGSRGINQLGHEPITDLLRTIASTHPDLTHWIPYWRLETQGGYIDWTCRIDNPSKLPNEEAFTRGFKEPEIQSWLYPGTGGWCIPSASARL